MAEQKKEQIVKEPLVGGICQILAALSAVAGGAMIVFAIFTPAAPGELSFVLTAVGLILSSVLWFAIARVIILLAKIAHNTREQ